MNMRQKATVTELNLRDVPSISDKMKYYDGEIYFADNITSVPGLMKMFRVNFIAFVFCLDGNINLQLDGRDFSLRGRDGLFVDSQTVVTIQDHSDDFSCKICAFNTDVGFNFISKSMFEAIMQIQLHPVIHFSEKEKSLMMKYYELVDFKMNNPQLTYGKETIGYIFRAYAYDLLASVGQHLDANDGYILRQGDKLFRRFVLMLADGSRHERSVKSYADELCVSAKYLTSVCRQHSNKTAGELIALSVIGRIKQLLLYSDLSIKEVAAEMNFDNLSFFGKYVKKHLGHSPNNYRRLNGYGR